MTSHPNQNCLYDVLVGRRKEIERLSINIDNIKARLEQMINNFSEEKQEEPEIIELESMSGIYKEVDLSDENAVSERLSEVYAWGMSSGLSFIPPHLILHNMNDENDNKESKIFIKTSKPTEGNVIKEIYPLSLSEGKGVRIIHRGSFFTSGDTWKRLFQYIEKKHLAIIGYGREIKNLMGPSVTIEVQVKDVLI
ncbi:GyrI-like domain-containing protein [Gracilinema caldarium]|uniref:GyrI-like domain-containing protein n=1 Tax=Gracilinema caldarium TaxID=215591 RepID=UPI0002FE8CBC|nr:GyrI-like domain-containing protein [Gracilinema caldarium]